MERLSALENGLGTIAETQIGASKTTCEIDDKNRIEE
jgi:archaellum component FlaC